MDLKEQILRLEFYSSVNRTLNDFQNAVIDEFGMSSSQDEET